MNADGTFRLARGNKGTLFIRESLTFEKSSYVQSFLLTLVTLNLQRSCHIPSVYHHSNLLCIDRHCSLQPTFTGL
jgi:hypothetical protein